MISFASKVDDSQKSSKLDEDNRFVQIRKAAAESHRKSDTDKTRRDGKKGKDNPLV